MGHWLRLLLLGCVLFVSSRCLAAEIGRLTPISSPVAVSTFSLTEPVEGRRGLEVAVIAALVVLAAGQFRFGKPAFRKPRGS